MFTEKLGGGTWISLDFPLVLPDDTKNALLEKWEMANDDGEVDDLLKEAEAIAHPSAFVIPVSIDELNEDSAVLGGIRFESTLLSQQLSPLMAKENPTVYAYTITCGMDLHQWSQSQDDILLQSVAEDISVRYLYLAAAALREYISENYFHGRHFSAMNPGSLHTWDITNQKPLFRLLGEGAEKCGVELNDSMLMIPFKSGSGVYYESEHNFESCMFCDKLNCPNRRAEFKGNE
ncbi:MAG: hypothetical protein IKI93_05145 [Clostridia bacterium]|nr:hypothetical protein [Clostridia bacterium]